MHSRNFGCHVSVRPPVHSLGGGEKGIRCQPIGGRSMLYFLGRKFVQPAFFLAGNRARNGVAIVVALKNLFTLGTCFQLFHGVRIL